MFNSEKGLLFEGNRPEARKKVVLANHRWKENKEIEAISIKGF
jgi:hypothetical protein